MGLHLTIFSVIKETKSESKKNYIFGIIRFWFSFLNYTENC